VMAAVPAAAARPAAGVLRFPDGSTRPALNGVTDDVELQWPAQRPFAAIVEVVAQAGTDFYRHADGTFTTTVIRRETVSGKMLQIGLCYTPSPAGEVGQKFAPR